MRAIKFRGKGIKSGQWFYGSVVPFGNNAYIFKMFRLLRMEHAEVDPDTVGQFTGLTDKNGKEIYDGDILRTPPKNNYDKENYVTYEVFWHGNDCASNHIGWQMNRCHFQGCICGTMYIPEFLPNTTAKMEVVGNVHDNPELIKKRGQQ